MVHIEITIQLRSYTIILYLDLDDYSAVRFYTHIDFLLNSFRVHLIPLEDY